MRKMITICVLFLLSCASGFANGPSPRNADIYVGTVVAESVASTTAKVEELRAQQATESADLLAATASETVLVAAIETVRQEIEDSGVNASETVLIAKLDELLIAAASDTLMIAAIETVRQEIEDSGVNASETVLVASLETVRQEIEDSGVNASETVIIAKLDELLVAAASDTLMIAAIEAVETEVASGNVAINDSVQEVKTAVQAVESALDPADIATQTISLTGAAASVQITSGLTGTRRYISISSQNVNQNIAIWINFGGAASTGVGELMYTGVSYPFDEDVDVWLYSDTTVDVYVIEGGTL